MEAARSAINKITGLGGRHETDVDEVVNPAVTQETVKPHRHEETTTAVDKEVHQDHYHTTVQPLQDREVLPEKHHHQQLPTQEREIRHGDNSGVHQKVEAEAAQFSNTSATAGTTHSASQGRSATGEHVHHHVHETVQPVIHKEVHQPEVVHTTMPIHEKHHAPSEHHGMSVLPTKTLGEVESSGQAITGGAHRSEKYEGDPRHYNSNLQIKQNEVDRDPEDHDGLHGSHGHTSTSTQPHASTATSGVAAGIATAGATTHGTHHHNDRSASATTTQGTHHHSDHSAPTTTTQGSHHIGDHTAHSTTTQGYTESSNQPSGHGITNQVHHGSSRDNVGRGNEADDIQHGTQSRDPAVVDKAEKKLTGTGEDGSHSALFGLTPDGHKTKDTDSTTTGLKPAHSKNVSNVNENKHAQGGLPGQLNDPRVAEKGHGGSAVSNTGTAKPGAGAPGGEQGFGQIRPEEHGATEKMQNKIDPTTDADGDGKRGVMD